MKRRCWLSFTLIATITVWSSFDTGFAEAGCGAYVMVDGESHQVDHTLPAVPTCRGPHCQRRAPLPLGPTKSLVDATSLDSVLHDTSASRTRPSLSDLVFEESFSLAEGHTWPPLRPPSR